MPVNAYLFFEGRCEEAIAFYKSAVDARAVMVAKFKDAPPGAEMGGNCKAEMADKVMHAELQIGESTIFVSDGMSDGPAKFTGFGLSITAATVEAANERFAALGDGGHVHMPMTPTFYSPAFGMVVDRFGVLWMVMVPQPM